MNDENTNQSERGIQGEKEGRSGLKRLGIRVDM
jgi:hypothetical protein